MTTLDVAAIKKDFPILERQVHDRRLVFLDSAASSQKPRAVLDAVADELADREHQPVDLLVAQAGLLAVAPRRHADPAQGRGAGDSAVELDRRKIRDRLAELREGLAAIEREQDNRRYARRDQLRVALVGYTDNVLTARSLAGRHGYRIDPNQELLALGLTNLTGHPAVALKAHVCGRLLSYKPG